MGKKFQIKRGNETDMPILAAGEPGFALDTKKMFVGTGVENVPINSGRMQEEAEAVAEIGSNVTAINGKMGSEADGGGSATSGSIFGKLNALIGKLTGSWTDARAGYLDYLANGTYGLPAIMTSMSDSSTKLGASTDTGGTATAGTVMGKLNALYANSKNTSFVKSVQRGTGKMRNGGVSINISGVVPSRCHVTVSGAVVGGFEVYVSGLSSYSLSVACSPNNGAEYPFGYEILEFY